MSAALLNHGQNVQSDNESGSPTALLQPTSNQASVNPIQSTQNSHPNETSSTLPSFPPQSTPPASDTVIVPTGPTPISSGLSTPTQAQIISSSSTTANVPSSIKTIENQSNNNIPTTLIPSNTSTTTLSTTNSNLSTSHLLSSIPTNPLSTTSSSASNLILLKPSILSPTVSQHVNNLNPTSTFPPTSLSSNLSQLLNPPQILGHTSYLPPSSTVTSPLPQITTNQNQHDQQHSISDNNTTHNHNQLEELTVPTLSHHSSNSHDTSPKGTNNLLNQSQLPPMIKTNQPNQQNPFQTSLPLQQLHTVGGKTKAMIYPTQQGNQNTPNQNQTTLMSHTNNNNNSSSNSSLPSTNNLQLGSNQQYPSMLGLKMTATSTTTTQGNLLDSHRHHQYTQHQHLAASLQYQQQMNSNNNSTSSTPSSNSMLLINPLIAHSTSFGPAQQVLLNSIRKSQPQSNVGLIQPPRSRPTLYSLIADPTMNSTTHFDQAALQATVLVPNTNQLLSNNYNTTTQTTSNTSFIQPQTLTTQPSIYSDLTSTTRNLNKRGRGIDAETYDNNAILPPPPHHPTLHPGTTQHQYSTFNSPTSNINASSGNNSDLLPYVGGGEGYRHHATAYSTEEQDIRLERWQEKRQQIVEDAEQKSQIRKQTAENRPRKGGRFIKKSEAEKLQAQQRKKEEQQRLQLLQQYNQQQ